MSSRRQGGRPGGKRPTGPATRSRQAHPGRPGRAEGRNQARQRRNRIYAFSAVVAVVAILAVVVIVAVASGGTGTNQPRQPVSAAAASQLEKVPLATMTDAVSKVGPANLNYASKAAGGALTSDGKPELLYVGAEFCPVCAAERWPMTLALMKFGTFHNLAQTRSAQADGDAGTFSYHGATYDSKYLAFDAQELYTNERSGGYYKELEKITPRAQQAWAANEGANLTFPFVDFGGQAVLRTSQFQPDLISYKDFDYVLGVVGQNDNPLGARIDAAAAVFTKYLCAMTNNQPGDVCSAVAGVSAPVTSTAGNAQTSPSG